jgi:hypothetical protein
LDAKNDAIFNDIQWSKCKLVQNLARLTRLWAA